MSQAARAKEKLITTGSMMAPDAELERSITHEWNAKIVTYPNDEFPFNVWILNRVRMMGYKIDDLSYLHESVPRDEVFKVTKQLCADTNLPEFRRMLHRFVREVVVPKGKLRTPVAVQRFMNVRIMLPTTPDLFFPFHTGLLYGHGIASRSLWMPFTSLKLPPMKRSVPSRAMTPTAPPMLAMLALKPRSRAPVTASTPTPPAHSCGPTRWTTSATPARAWSRWASSR